MAASPHGPTQRAEPFRFSTVGPRTGADKTERGSAASPSSWRPRVPAPTAGARGGDDVGVWLLKVLPAGSTSANQLSIRSPGRWPGRGRPDVGDKGMGWGTREVREG